MPDTSLQDIAEVDYLIDQHDPVRPVDWYARHVLAWPASGVFRTPDSATDPAHVRTAVASPRQTPDPRFSVTPAVVEAQAIARTPSWQRAVLESFLLAGETDDTISLHTQFSPDVVHAYSQLFYDVRDRRGAIFCIAATLGFCPRSVSSNVRWLARWMGYNGGPAILQQVLPTLEDFHRQAVEPLELNTKGLPFGKQLQAQLIINSGALPAELLIEIELELRGIPDSDRDRWAVAIILKHVGAAQKPRAPKTRRPMGRRRTRKTACQGAAVS